jgi:hypothetical protein
MIKTEAPHEGGAIKNKPPVVSSLKIRQQLAVYETDLYFIPYS